MRLLDPQTSIAVVLGASDWSLAKLPSAPSFRRSAAHFCKYLIGHPPNGLGLEPDALLNLFDDPSPAGSQLTRIRDTLKNLIREKNSGIQPIRDVLIYYVGHGSREHGSRLHMLVRDSTEGLEATSSIGMPDLARVLRVAAPRQRRLVILDCCFSEAAVDGFSDMANMDEAVASEALHDLAPKHSPPDRGTILFCSSPRGRVSIGPPNAERTLFTGAMLKVLMNGMGTNEMLSFADLNDETYNQMLADFDGEPPRPALHQPEQQEGDLTRIPAFPNAATFKRQQAHPAGQTTTKGNNVSDNAANPFSAENTIRFEASTPIAVPQQISLSDKNRSPPPSEPDAPSVVTEEEPQPPPLTAEAQHNPITPGLPRGIPHPELPASGNAEEPLYASPSVDGTEYREEEDVLLNSIAEADNSKPPFSENANTPIDRNSGIYDLLKRRKLVVLATGALTTSIAARFSMRFLTSPGDPKVVTNSNYASPSASARLDSGPVALPGPNRLPAPALATVEKEPTPIVSNTITPDAINDDHTGWQIIEDGFTRSGIDPMAIHMSVDGKMGWAVGGDYMSGKISTTNDGGTSWTKHRTKSAGSFWAISFSKNEQIGWTVATQGFIYKTVNKGVDWSPVASGTTENLSGVAVSADGRLVYIVGPSKFLLIFRDNVREHVTAPGRIGYWGVHLDSDSGFVWIVGDNGTIQKTEDGGRNWTRQITPTRDDLVGIHFLPDGKNGWAVGNGGTIISTLDGGVTWTPQDSPAQKNRLCSICFDSKGQNGWAVGTGGTILATKDGGKVWEAQASRTESSLNCVEFRKSSLDGWACGDTALLRTQNGGWG